VTLPSIAHQQKLPVVLRREEVKRLLKSSTLLKHRILIGLHYDCGLRCLEVRILQISDIDLGRRMIHVRQSKGKKDRYVPIGKYSATVFKDICRPNTLLNGYFLEKNFAAPKTATQSIFVSCFKY
jgi:site-specific recombinase XerD